MPARSTRRPAGRQALSVDGVLLALRARRLAVLLLRPPPGRGRERWVLPWEAPAAGMTLEAAAAGLARRALGVAPALLEQVGAFGDGRRHPSGLAVSVAYLGLAGGGAAVEAAGEWLPVGETPALAPRQRAILDAALAALRARLDRSPIAFRLLPPTFTLSELQEAYELLLGRRLHKASFRRALQAAGLVEPTEAWRSEGRGRPAQLFRYAPRRRRGGRRGIRFEGLGS